MSGSRALTDEELECIKSKLANKRDRLLFIFGYRTGLRISELLSIQIKHIYKFDRISDTIFISKDNLKGKKEAHELPIHPELKKELKDFLTESDIKNPEHYLFKSRKGLNRAITRHHVSYILKKIFNNLELEGRVSTHSMRKTLAWKFYKASGNDLRSTQKALRHKFIESTIRYIDPDKKEVDKLMLKLL